MLALLDPIEAGSSDPFTRGRATAFRQAATDFASMGGGTLDAFVSFVDEFRGSATADRGAVQILTFHKAKGLEYDIVLLPIEAAKRLDCVDTGAMGPWPKGSGKGEWIMELPAEVICQTDERLEEALESSRAESCYEELCVHYVGMTRAAPGPPYLHGQEVG